jgi:hypothetical protein
VLGLNEKKGLARVNFSKVGMKELKLPAAKLEAAEATLQDKHEETLRISYKKRDGDARGCVWLLSYNDDSAAALIHDIRTWTNTKVSLADGAKVRFDEVKKGELELKINGNGRDGRCRWCRTYRSALKTAVRKKFGRDGYIFNGGCPFV